MLTRLKSRLHRTVGIYLIGKGRFDEAAAHFSEVIRLCPNHPAAYVSRGIALQGMNDHHRAISDFDQAIALDFCLDKHRALAYGARGVSWKFLEDFDRAAADNEQALAFAPTIFPLHAELGILAHFLAHFRYDFDAAVAHLDQAIKLAPRNASYYLLRGRARFDRGNFTAAESDLRYSINIADNPYALLFWYLASCKTHRNADEELASRARRLNDRKWPFPIIALYLRKTGEDAVRAAAATADDRAEAEFYIGEWHLLARRRTEAIAALQVAAKSCPRWFMEHTAAVMELKRQGAPLTPDVPGPVSPDAPARDTQQ
jgi:lipoprotein NlpI